MKKFEKRIFKPLHGVRRMRAGLNTFVTVLIILCMAVFLVPAVSRAAVIHYFVAANDTLLPFDESTMPYVSDGEIFVPDKVFSQCGVFSLSSVESELVQLYGGGKRLYFSTAQNGTKDIDGNMVECSPARRIGRRFYVPLDFVCEYFGLTCGKLIEIPRDIIPNEQMYVLRIISNAVFNDKTFVGINSKAIAASYNDYYAPPPPPPPPSATPEQPAFSPSPGVSTPPPPSETPSPTYRNVTVYLSFFNVGAGYAGRILDTLNAPAATGYPSCFFVSAAEIAANPELIRIISGSGHTVGVWLESGTYREYLEASALLFEAAKAKTVIVSSGAKAASASAMARLHGLIFFDASRDFSEDEDMTEDAVIDELPTTSGERVNLRFACTQEQVQILPGVLLYLGEKEYNVVKISETVLPPGANG